MIALEIVISRAGERDRERDRDRDSDTSTANGKKTQRDCKAWYVYLHQALQEFMILFPQLSLLPHIWILFTQPTCRLQFLFHALINQAVHVILELLLQLAQLVRRVCFECHGGDNKESPDGNGSLGLEPSAIG